MYEKNLRYYEYSHKKLEKIPKNHIIDSYSYKRSDMRKPSLWWIFQFTLWTGIFFVILNYFGFFLWPTSSLDDDFTKIERPSEGNIARFSPSYSQKPLPATIGVAITTNIGTRFKQMSQTPVTAYKWSVEIGGILANQSQAKDELISYHMLALNEYYHILQTDIRSLLSGAIDRGTILDAFIDQLEYRYEISVQNMQMLTSQKAELTIAYNNSHNDVENIKRKMGTDFADFNAPATLQNIDMYLARKQENTNAYAYIVFIEKFLNYYETLNEYNKLVLDTLINNREILIKNTQVVIPDTGWELLRQLNLLYDEADWKGR